MAELVDDCVHCGFCLPACPTYRLWGEEMDSPRGRIHLMRGLLEGQALDRSTVAHFDLCLGCMACVPACPSGVAYDRLIEAARAEVEDHHRRPFGERIVRRAIFALFPYPKRLRRIVPMARLAQRLGAHRLLGSRPVQRLVPHLATAVALVPDLRGAPVRPVPSVRGVPAIDSLRPGPTRVGLLTGCVQSVIFPQVNEATGRVLEAEGCAVVVPADQGCCGALSLHAGRTEEARAFAKALLARFDVSSLDAVVTNAAGCGSTLKHYGALLADDPRWAAPATQFAQKVADVTELLARIGPRAPRTELAIAVAYHDACHLSHAQMVRDQPRQLLKTIPGLDLREIPDGEVCCGSAGIYNLVQTDAARQLGDEKAANVERTGASVLVSGNPGCTMQIQAALARRGRPIPVMHTVELLDVSLRGTQIHPKGSSFS
jgi:glycolate oxidase iron-sulfur subunit